jgi:kynurenine formamidase
MATTRVPDDIPLYDELPILDAAGERHVWEAFGREDELGCLNFLTPEATVAAAREVVIGRVVNLNLPVDQPHPQFWSDREAVRHIHVKKRSLRDDYLDGFQMQGSTQWDGLRHQRYREFGWYGGRQEHELDELGQLGIERWAEHGIVGRGVLADVAGFCRRRGTPLASDERFRIDGPLIDDVLSAQGTDLRPGDVLLVRTGWLGWYLGLDPVDRESLSTRLNADRSAIALPGIDPSQAMAAWIWDHRVAALAVDNPTAETGPYVPAEGWAHHRLLTLLGLPLGELFALDGLAQVCDAEQRYSFLFCSVPLNLTGGAGSPANAYAIL